jgi:hypothetical protein
MATNERMSSIKQTATLKGDTHMNTNRETSAMKESNMKLTASNLIRWTGLAAMAAGIYFAAIQPIHPADVVASVTTSAWAIITPLKTGMCLLFLIGFAGLYARQVKKVGWVGLAGFVLLSVMWWLQTAFVFAEAFILPLLASSAPKFVDGVLGIGAGRASEVNLGALPAIYGAMGILYMLGGLLFGIATFRAGILPRWAAALLAVASALTPLAALLPHATQRLAAIPVGLAVAWLGFALLSERREQASEPVPSKVNPQLSSTAAE